MLKHCELMNTRFSSCTQDRCDSQPVCRVNIQWYSSGRQECDATVTGVDVVSIGCRYLTMLSTSTDTLSGSAAAISVVCVRLLCSIVVDDLQQCASKPH